MNPSTIIPLVHRTVLSLQGKDCLPLLEGLITQTLRALETSLAQSVYFSALLSPQGRFLHDFFIFFDGTTLYLTPEKNRSQDLLDLLNRHKLRLDVEIKDESTSLCLAASFEKSIIPGIWFEDPRVPAMGFVGIVKQEDLLCRPVRSLDDYDRRRILLGIPDGSRDLTVDKSIILENNYDELHAISWTKGCYRGQELMARTHHQGMVRKRLFPVRIEGSLPPFGTEIFFDAEKVGVLKSTINIDQEWWGLALLQKEKVQRAPFKTLDGKTSFWPVIPEFLA